MNTSIRDLESLAIFDAHQRDLADARPPEAATDARYELNQIVGDMLETECRWRINGLVGEADYLNTIARSIWGIANADAHGALADILATMIEVEARTKGDDELSAPADDSPQSIWAVARGIVQEHIAHSDTYSATALAERALAAYAPPYREAK